MSQRMVCGRQSGNVKFQAWAASLVLHLVVLTVFGVVEFSRFTTQVGERPTPTAKLDQIKKLAQVGQIMSKPKVKESCPERSTVRASRLLPTDGMLCAAKPRGRNLRGFAEASGAQSALLLSSTPNFPYKVEFFGTVADERKVCYVVDCSGSMRGIFAPVRKRLKESIEGLQPDQYFCIIFFGGEKLFEFGGGRLLRAAQRNKSDAYDFVDSVLPAGQTNALMAMERAVQVRDSQGSGPSIIYFLTDGFELANGDARGFSQKVEHLRKSFAPAARVSTIGFWTQGGDREMLEAIAEENGGESVFVGGGT